VALNQTLAQLRASVRSFANVGGTTALLKHPNASVNDYINRALGSLYRRLTMAVPDQRYLSSAEKTTTSGTTLYAFSGFTPAVTDFDHLISVDLEAGGLKQWLLAYEMHERPELDNPSDGSGIPYTYRLRGDSIELLPEPTGSYTVTIWYVPNAPNLTSDSQTFDTISRLDDYVIAYAARLIATRDKNWDLVAEARRVCQEMESEIETLARSRDKNSPSVPVDDYIVSRWGRRR
jgi:hypothetical protein